MLFMLTRYLEMLRVVLMHPEEVCFVTERSIESDGFVSHCCCCCFFFLFYYCLSIFIDAMIPLDDYEKTQLDFVRQQLGFIKFHYLALHIQSKSKLCDLLMQRIQERARPGEIVTRSYLERLHDKYDEFFKKTKCIFVNNFDLK
jgi:hypothetical protein